MGQRYRHFNPKFFFSRANPLQIAFFIAVLSVLLGIILDISYLTRIGLTIIFVYVLYIIISFFVD